MPAPSADGRSDVRRRGQASPPVHSQRERDSGLRPRPAGAGAVGADHRGRRRGRRDAQRTPRARSGRQAVGVGLLEQAVAYHHRHAARISKVDSSGSWSNTSSTNGTMSTSRSGSPRTANDNARANTSSPIAVACAASTPHASVNIVGTISRQNRVMTVGSGTDAVINPAFSSTFGGPACVPAHDRRRDLQRTPPVTPKW
jgi:hypothetical protein